GAATRWKPARRRHVRRLAPRRTPRGSAPRMRSRRPRSSTGATRPRLARSGPQARPVACVLSFAIPVQAELRPSAYTPIRRSCCDGAARRALQALDRVGVDLHPDAPLPQVDAYHEGGAAGVPRLPEPLDAGEHAGHDADAIADADPRHGPRAVGGDDPADGFHLLVRHGMERVPAFAEDAHDAVGAGDAHVGLARGREAE